MSSPDIPPAPAAPDYANANKEGIYTDIETLPIRRQIDQASRAGQSVTYMDPRTGETRTADFTGMGDVELARQAANVATDTNAAVQRQQLQLREELGVRNAEQTAKEVAAADPVAYQARNTLTQKVLGDMNAPTTTVNTDTNLSRLANASAMDPSKQALDVGVKRAVDDFNLGGDMDAQTRNEVLNDVRSGQAARGNALGNAAMFAEAQEVGKQAEARRASRLAQLLDVQNRSFSQGQQGLGLQAALTGQQLQENRATRAENYGQQQQRLANASAFVLGQPITNQFGSLAAAQQGAVGFNPIAGAPGISQNANAGQNAAGFQQQNFGTLSNIWSTQANLAQQQSNQMNSMIGQGAGMAAGLMM
jgi:hypothetical protein